MSSETESTVRPLVSADEQARHEEEQLAPYAMLSRQSRGRKYAGTNYAFRGAYRGAYQRDRERIIHCTAFRRLEYKTQVFVNHEGDRYRTRLTHTLEVAQISRSIARAMRLNEDLSEAIALAHDLGHTPFGHSGEEALHELMAEYGGFEHNRHGLRVVDVLEQRYPDFPGLNLSYEVREGIAKHSTPYDRPVLDTEFADGLRPVLEAQVIEAADEIAYNNHDLDDGLAAGIITTDDLAELELWRTAYDRVEQYCPAATEHMKALQTVAALINLEVTDLIEHSQKLLAEDGVRTVEDVRHAGRNLVDFSPHMRELKAELEQFHMDRVYRHYRVARMATKARRFVQEIFTEYLDNPEQLPPEYFARIAGEGPHRVIADYIAGMTDRYAQDESKRLFYPFERV
jgi:dGTPase